MSFSADAKAELIRLPMERECCAVTELSALTQTTGSLTFHGGGRISVIWQVENAALARRIFRMLKDGLGFAPTLQFVQHARLGGRRTCVLTVGETEAPRLLTLLRMMEPGEDGQPVLRRTLPRPQVTRACCRRAYLRGAFLGAGSVIGPDRGYHLEIVCRDEGLREMAKRQFEHAGIRVLCRTRRGIQVLYLKEAQAVADALALMGASQAVMKFENMRITRQMRGEANRASNCDEHNTERQLTASQEQVDAIKLLAIHQGLFTLPPALREMAELRLSHPEASLEELGQLREPPLSKSGVSGRMRRLMQAAKTLGEQLRQAEQP